MNDSRFEKQGRPKKIDELRLKNALRCQYGSGAQYCQYCPYKGTDDGKCNISAISLDALQYIKNGDDLIDLVVKQCRKDLPVRCEYCLAYKMLECTIRILNGQDPEPDWYCADGERR